MQSVCVSTNIVKCEVFLLLKCLIVWKRVRTGWFLALSSSSRPLLFVLFIFDFEFFFLSLLSHVVHLFRCTIVVAIKFDIFKWFFSNKNPKSDFQPTKRQKEKKQRKTVKNVSKGLSVPFNSRLIKICKRNIFETAN